MYRHTQIGYAMMAFGLIPAAIAIRALWSWPARVALIPLIVGVVALALIGLFSVLTVSVDEAAVRWNFALGLFERTIALGAVADARIVTPPWYAGWGIRWTLDGWLYRVSGLRAVAIRTHDGRTTCLGTDEPDRLLAAILEGVEAARAQSQVTRR
jgi:hypothetical protein